MTPCKKNRKLDREIERLDQKENGSGGCSLRLRRVASCPADQRQAAAVGVGAPRQLLCLLDFRQLAQFNQAALHCF